MTRKELSHTNGNGLPGQKRPDSTAFRGIGGLQSDGFQKSGTNLHLCVIDRKVTNGESDGFIKK